jgi:hypothetical protein
MPKGPRQKRITDGARRNFGLPPGQRPAPRVLVMTAFARLEDHARSPRPDHLIGQHEGVAAPTDLQGASHPRLGVYRLQVLPQQGFRQGVDFNPHRQQLTAHLIAEPS